MASPEQSDEQTEIVAFGDEREDVGNKSGEWVFGRSLMTVHESQAGEKGEISDFCDSEISPLPEKAEEGEFESNKYHEPAEPSFLHSNKSTVASSTNDIESLPHVRSLRQNLRHFMSRKSRKSSNMSIDSDTQSESKRKVAARSFLKREKSVFEEYENPPERVGSIHNFAILGRVRLQMHKRAMQARRNVQKKRSLSARIIFLPTNKWRIAWDVVMLLIVLYSSFEIPFNLIFIGASCEMDWKNYLSLAFDLFFSFDILVNFNTAYANDLGWIIKDHLLIATRYASGWLWFDVLSSLPLDRILCSHEFKDAFFARIFKALRLLKMIRLVRASRVLRRWYSTTSSEQAKVMIQVTELIAAIVFGVHLFGCLWRLLIDLVDCKVPIDTAPMTYNMRCHCNPEEEDCEPWNWLYRFDPVLYRAEGRYGSKYLLAVYFSVVALGTIGFGEVLPCNDIERVYATILSFAGVLFLSLCVTALSELALAENSAERILGKSLKGLEHFLVRAGITPALVKKADIELRHISVVAPGLIHSVVNHISFRTGNEVMSCLASDTLSKIDFFRQLDMECKAVFAKLLVPRVVLASEYLFKELEVGDGMYWVVSGSLEIMDHRSRVLFHEMSSGIIGEINVVEKWDLPYRVYNVRAKCYSTLLYLSKRHFQNEIKMFCPNVKRSIEDIAKLRLMMIGKEELRHQEISYGKLSLQRAAVLKEFRTELEGQVRLKARSRTSSIVSVINSVVDERTRHTHREIAPRYSAVGLQKAMDGAVGTPAFPVSNGESFSFARRMNEALNGGSPTKDIAQEIADTLILLHGELDKQISSLAQKPKEI